MMKIAFFTDTYYPTIDGVVSTIQNCKSLLQKKGVDIKIFAPSPSDQKDKIEGVVYAPSINFFPYPQYKIPISTKTIKKECELFEPQIIHSHAMVIMGLAAKNIAKKLKIPLIGTFHTFLPQAVHYFTKNEGLELWLKNICWKYLNYFYNDFDAVISPSEFVQRKLKENGIESKYVIPNGVDLKFFNPQKTKKEYFLYLGRIAKEKNLDIILEIASQKEFEKLKIPIVLAGDGPYVQELKREVEKLNLNVKFFGKVEQKQLPYIYSKAYAFITLSEFETFGMSALEAMACKVPLVCLKNTALEEFTKNGGGISCYKETYQIIQALVEILENKETFSAAAYKTAKKYSIENSTRKLLELYKKFV